MNVNIYAGKHGLVFIDVMAYNCYRYATLKWNMTLGLVKSGSTTCHPSSAIWNIFANVDKWIRDEIIGLVINCFQPWSDEFGKLLWLNAISYHFCNHHPTNSKSWCGSMISNILQNNARK